MTILRTHTISRIPGLAAAAAMGGLIGALCLVSPVLAVIAVLGVAFTLLILRYPIILCYIMVAAVTLVSGVTRGKLLPVLRPNEALLALSFGFTLLVIITNRHRWPNLRRLGEMLLIFGVLVFGNVAFPMVYHASQGNFPSIEGILDLFAPFKFFMLYLVFALIPVREEEWYPLVIWMLICGAIVSLVGLLQAAGFGPIRNLIGTWYASEQTTASLESTEGRITSLMGAWNTLGMLLMAVIAVGWASLQVPEMRRYRPVALLALVVCFLCQVASGSFAGLFGTVAAVLIVERLTNPLGRTLKKIGLAVALAAGGLLLASPVIMGLVTSRLVYQFGGGELLPQTFTYRFWIWTDVFWPEIVKHPLFGTALEIGPHYRWLYAESHYISLLFRFGLMGLVSHLIWVGLLLGWLRRHTRSASPFQRMMAAAAFAMLVVLSVSALTNEVFMFTGCIDYLWILLALVTNRKEQATA